MIEDLQRRHVTALKFVQHLRGVVARAVANNFPADRIRRLRRDLKFAETDAAIVEASLANAREPLN